MEFSKLARPPPPAPLFGKLLRMTCCFDLWRLKIRGVTLNYSYFWSGEVEGGHTYETFLFYFWMFQVKLIILRGTFYPYKNNDFYGMDGPLTPPFG